MTTTESRRDASAAPSPSRARLAPLGALALLTVFAGAVRFAWPSHPPLWADEALTCSRVVGTYRELLAILRDDGFAPLHYELYWLVARFVHLSPAAMRLVPALAGTLIVPAMYFLVAQLFPRRVALTAAAFCACSAFLLAYSRDAKMYMPVWLLSVLNLGCFLWWLRTRRSTAWLAWVAVGVAAGGYSPIALVVLVVQPVMLLIARRPRWVDGPVFVLGLAVIASGPGGYYATFNRWVGQSGGIAPGVGEQGRAADDWYNTGIAWVDEWTVGRPTSELVLHSATGYAYGFTRFKETPDAEARMPRGVARATGALPWVFGGLAVLGLFPWRARVGASGLAAPLAGRWSGDRSITDQRPATGAAKQMAGEASVDHWWRGAAFAGLWLLLPWYGVFYCRSIDGFQPPLAALAFVMSDSRFAIVGAIAGVVAFFCAGRTMRERVRHLTSMLFVVGVVLGACHVAYLLWHGMWTKAVAANPGLDWKSIWFPRYLGVVTPALGLALVLLFLRLPTRPLRWGAVGLLLGVNLFNGVARLASHTEPRVDLMAADAWAARDEASDVRAFVPYRGAGFGSVGGGLSDIVGMYYLWHVSGKTVTPQEFRNVPPGVLFPFVRFGAPDFDQPPHVRRLIVWDYGDPAPEDPGTAPRGWTLIDEDRYPLYIWYNWQRMGQHRRRVYERD